MFTLAAALELDRPAPDPSAPDDEPPTLVPRSCLVLTADPRQQQQAIRDMISRAGSSQADLARRLDIERQSIQEYLRGKRTLTVPQVVKWAACCRASVLIQLPPDASDR